MRNRFSCQLMMVAASVSMVVPAANAQEGKRQDLSEGGSPPAVAWMDDYAAARRQAATDGRLLLIYFHGDGTNLRVRRFEAETLVDPRILRLCDRYVAVRISLDTTIAVEGEPVRLLDHESFRYMNDEPGLAIVDFEHVGLPFYEHTVGCLPFEDPVYYAPDYGSTDSVATFLDLPPGTITQRSMVYAVRMHPEQPASTAGAPHPDLFEACRAHSQDQADRRLQGHHNWERRFHAIWKKTGGRHSVEVCAESWPDKTMLAACIDCVHSWRQSSGHWNAVRGEHPAYGYDIRRGSNGIWYATGILGARAPAPVAKPALLD